MVDDVIEPRELSPRRLFPWWRLLNGIGLALDGRKLILAVLGIVLLWAGWAGLNAVFPESSDVTPLTRPDLIALGAVRAELDPLALSAWTVGEPIGKPARPFLELFRLGGGNLRFVHALAATLWALLVWGVVGGAIARVAVVQVASAGDRPSASQALRFALGKIVPLVGAPLGALGGVAFFAALCALLGLLYQIPGEAGATIAGALAFLPLLAALVMTLILIGLATGWPLMVASIAAEGEDAFDAWSRTYSYVYQRPISFAFYVVVAWVVGALGFLIVVLLALRVLVPLAAWGLAFGAPDAVIAAYFGPLSANPDTTAAVLHSGWISLVTLLTYGWVYSYFWSAAAQIYLLLRHDVDGAAFSDIYLPEHNTDTFAPEPPPARSEEPAPSA